MEPIGSHWKKWNALSVAMQPPNSHTRFMRCTCSLKMPSTALPLRPSSGCWIALQQPLHLRPYVKELLLRQLGFCMCSGDASMPSLYCQTCSTFWWVLCRALSPRFYDHNYCYLLLWDHQRPLDQKGWARDLDATRRPHPLPPRTPLSANKRIMWITQSLALHMRRSCMRRVYSHYCCKCLWFYVEFVP